MKLTYVKRAFFLSIIFLSFSCSVAISQHAQELHIVEADNAWGKEILNFPLEWAPKMTVKGFVELRFSPGWSNKNSEEFWSLVMAWNIHANSLLTLKEIVLNLEGYFEGLMKPNHWATQFPEPKLVLQEQSKKKFVGTMKFFDGFHSGKMLNINVYIEQTYCKLKRRLVVIIRFSPQPLENSIWKKLNEVKLRADFCSN
jgi:hypothetical protein